MRINLTLESPLMVGGKTLGNNYRKSLSYIPGGVLRAAFAKAIVDRCAYGNEPYDGKINWVQYRDKEYCIGCNVSDLCKQFSKIIFPTLFPKGGQPYPYTARECKYSDVDCKQPLIDLLIPKIKKQITTHCSCGASYEKVQGFHVDGEKVNVITKPATKTAMNYRLQTSKNGALYVLESVLPENEFFFTGIINCDKSIFQHIKTIRVGAYTTSGYGKCSLTYTEDLKADTKESMIQRIKDFNNILNLQDGYSYFSVDLLSDTYIDLELVLKDELIIWENSSFLKYLQEKIGLKAHYELCHAYKTQEALRGFSTWKEIEVSKNEDPEECAKKVTRRNAHIAVKAGGVFVFRTDKQIDYDYIWSIQENGIGRLNEHGFGQIRICDPFHIKYKYLYNREVESYEK